MFDGLFSDIFAPLTSTIDEWRYGQKVRKIVVAKPYCVPARNTITGTLPRYGVKILDYSEVVLCAGGADVPIDGYTPDMSAIKGLPVAQVATVTVSAKQAQWAEYLLLRTKKLRLFGKAQNQKNQAWADRHNGNMPPSWKDGKAWIERSCSEGAEAIKQFKKGNR